MSEKNFDVQLFQLNHLVKSNIKLSARSEVGKRQLIAFVMSSGDLSLHYLFGDDIKQLPVMRYIPWYTDSNKKIVAMTFDPTGTWLLVVGYDTSLFIVPALAMVDAEAVTDRRWTVSDISRYAPIQNSTNFIGKVPRPVCVVWWQSVMDCSHTAIVATDRGDLIFASLATGAQVGMTYVRAPAASLSVCSDNSMDSVFLLITSESRTQWKLLLEQRSTGHTWPLDSIGPARGPSSNSDLSSSHASIDSEYASKSLSPLPTARSRLQGLKELSVEKLASLRQRLAERRTKGVGAIARRESSSSSSDDLSSLSMNRKTSAASDSTEVPAQLTTGPLPDRLSTRVGETYICPQQAKNRNLLSGYYAPSNVLTIHSMNLDVVPLFVYKLPKSCKEVVVTDKFLFVVESSQKSVHVISSVLAETRLDGDSDSNPDSIISTFKFSGEEIVLSLYKKTDLAEYKKPADSNFKSSSDNKGHSNKSREKLHDKKTQFSLPKDINDVQVKSPPVDTVVIITTCGIYEIILSRTPTLVFLDLVLQHQELEKAERLALIFGLNLSELLEAAGDIKLSAKEFTQAIALYKLSRCRHLKSVLKFAACGYSVELLSFINMLFSQTGLDLTVSERIHLANLAMMSHTEQVLRAIMPKKAQLFKNYLKFLQDNLYYDEVLAVNVAGQTGLWEILQFLAHHRGLYSEVLDILSKIMKSQSGIETKAISACTLDIGLWMCVSDPLLLQSLLFKPQQAKIHLHFINTYLPYLETYALQRLASLYDPSSPSFRPSLRRLLKMHRRNYHLSESSGGSDTQMDSFSMSDDDYTVPVEEMVQTFLLILLHLLSKRQKPYPFDVSLMEKVCASKDNEKDMAKDSTENLPVQVNRLSAGFAFAALVRNGAVYTWGSAVQGCLGAGPTMSRYSIPQPISLFSNLRIEVSSVSCGRHHTLALTNNGVYSWGSSQYGQLGLGRVCQAPSPRLVSQLSEERIVAISAGQYHSLALTQDGRVYSWGWGVHGQLGHRSIEDFHLPAVIKGLIGKKVVQVSGGYGHTVVLTADGQVFTFGSSVFGQLGNGTNVKSSVPVHVAGLTEIITLVATGYFHNLAVSSSNKLYVWGSSPQVLRLQAQAQKKARLLQQQTLAQTSLMEHKMKNKFQLSDDIVSESKLLKERENESQSQQLQAMITSVPTNAPPSSSVFILSEATQHQRSISSTVESDKVACNGYTSDISVKALQKGDIAERPTDLPVLSKDVAPNSVVLDHSKEIPSKNSLPTNDLDLQVNQTYSPSSVADDFNLPSVVVSPTMEFKGLTSMCTGDSSPQNLKTPSPEISSQGEIDDTQAHLFPQLVDTSLITGTITQVSCGCHHSALLTKDGVLYMWGRNLDGQIGNGSRKEVPKPTPMSTSIITGNMKSPVHSSSKGPLSVGINEHVKLQQVCCGCEFTTALEVAGGRIWAWGSNSHGQLGKAPAETSKALEGKLVMLKTTKRVIKLPHGTHNSSDVPNEVPGIPSATISFRDDYTWTHLSYEQLKSSNLCVPLSSIEHPSYGARTLHFVLQHFYGHYDSVQLLNKCLELENFQAAAKIATLDRHYHLALAYQLQALAAAVKQSEQSNKENESNFDINVNKESSCMSSQKENAINLINKNQQIDDIIKGKDSILKQKHVIANKNKTVTNSENLKSDAKKKLSKLDLNPELSCVVEKFNKEITQSIFEEVEKSVSSEESLKKGNFSNKDLKIDFKSASGSATDSLQTNNSVDSNEMHTFAVQGGLEQMSDPSRLLLSPDSSPMTTVQPSEFPHHQTFPTPVSTPASEDESILTSVSRCEENLLIKICIPENTAENDVSVIVDEIIDNVTEYKNPSPEINDATATPINRHIEMELDSLPDDHNLVADNQSVNNVPEIFPDKQIVPDVLSSSNTDGKEDNVRSIDEERIFSESTAKTYLNECQNNTVHQASQIVEYYVSVMEEDSHTMMSRLLQQGIEFWLNHSLPVDQLENLLMKHMAKFFYPLGLLLFCKGNNPDKVESDTQQAVCMLNHLSTRFCLQLCSTLLGHVQEKKAFPEYIELLAQVTSLHIASQGINGCCIGGQDSDQLMEKILKGLSASESSGGVQSHLNIHDEVLNLCKDGEQLYAFSCGHQYNASTFHQTEVMELELGLLQLQPPLANAARTLKGLFEASSPAFHLACPRCVLTHLQGQSMQPS